MAKDNIIRGYSKSELSSYFRTNAFELVEGKHLNEQDRNKIMISDALAEKNHLLLGDNIHAELTQNTIDGGDPKQVFYKIDLEIAGIFHVNVNQVISEYTVEQDIAENFMFADFNTVYQARRAYFKAIALNKKPPYQKVTFFIDDPKEMEQILKEIPTIKDVDWRAFNIQPDDTTYQSSLTPLQNMSKISIFMMVFIIAVCTILLTLILRMWIGTRKKEMGILLSMGNSPGGIIGQFILEGVLLLCTALILSCIVSVGISNKVGNMMLSGMNAQEERKAERSDEIGAPPASTEDMVAYIQQFEVKTEVRAPEEIDCRITVNIVLVCTGILAVVLILTTVFSARKVLKMKPKEILSML